MSKKIQKSVPSETSHDKTDELFEIEMGKNSMRHICAVEL